MLREHPQTGIRRIRAELKARHGFACGTDRLRRLLRSVRAFLATQRQALSDETETLTLHEARAAAEAWRRRALLAEDREISHQRRWAIEIDALKQQLRNGGHSGSGGSHSDYTFLRQKHDFALRTITELRLELARCQQQHSDPKSEGG